MTVRAFKPVKISMGTTRGHSYNAADLRRQLNLLAKNFSNLEEHMGTEGAQIIHDALEPTFEKSQVRCPQRTGALKESGFLEVEVTPKGAQAVIGYARGGYPHYAIYVHEVPMMHKEPTTWKYLQGPLQEDQEEIQSRVLGGLYNAAGMGGS